MNFEQDTVVNRTSSYFEEAKKKEPDKHPRFLWNIKPGFGKAVATYELARKMGFKRILVLSFDAFLDPEWKMTFGAEAEVEDWQFVFQDLSDQTWDLDRAFGSVDQERPIAVLGAFRDLLFCNEKGAIRAKYEVLKTTAWDMVVFDGYQDGTWRENAHNLFNLDEDAFDFDREEYSRSEAGNACDESFLPISAMHCLFLSNLPIPALNYRGFMEEQVFNWTYLDEQRAGTDPSAPRLFMLTHDLSVEKWFPSWDLDTLFSAKETVAKKVKESRFLHEGEVQKWLDLVSRTYLFPDPSQEAPLPFSADSVPMLDHTVWLLPSVSSCWAMYHLLTQKRNARFQDYAIHVCAGIRAGLGSEALATVEKSMTDPLHSKTITLTCGKLMAGAAVPPWTGLFILRTLKSPESYFQACSCVQSPWQANASDGEPVMKKNGCVFDFDPQRALVHVLDVPCRVDAKEESLAEFLEFFPVFWATGETRTRLDANGLLDFEAVQFTSELLTRRWHSPMLVNVDNLTLRRLQETPKLVKALESTQRFRGITDDLNTILKNTEIYRQNIMDSDDEHQIGRKRISEEEKIFRNKRAHLQEKLLELIAIIPIFMYLTEHQEKCLQDILSPLRVSLFRKLMDMEPDEFEQLCTLGIFNTSLLNDLIFKFNLRRLGFHTYTGLSSFENKELLSLDAVLHQNDYKNLFRKQQTAMSQPSLTPAEAPPLIKRKIGRPAGSSKKSPSNMSPEELRLKREKLLAQARMKIQQEAIKKEQEEEEDRRYLDIRVKDKVYHKKFGAGIVQLLDKEHQRVSVTFPCVGEKNFLYPDSFKKKYLSVEPL